MSKLTVHRPLCALKGCTHLAQRRIHGGGDQAGPGLPSLPFRLPHDVCHGHYWGLLEAARAVGIELDTETIPEEGILDCPEPPADPVEVLGGIAEILIGTASLTQLEEFEESIRLRRLALWAAMPLASAVEAGAATVLALS